MTDITTSDEDLDAAVVSFMSVPSLRDDPFDFLERLRGEDPVHYSSAMGMWLISSREGCLSLTKDSRWSVDPVTHGPGASGDQGLARQLQHTMLLFKDDPVHARLRKVISPLLTPTMSEKWRARYREVVETTLAAAAQRGGVTDVVSAVGYPLALWVLVELLGLPQDAGPRLLGWTSDYVQVFEPTCTAEAEARANEVVAEMRAYLEPMLQSRKSGDITPDLMGAFAQAELDGILQGDEAIAYTLMMSVSAYDTSANLISLAILSLLTYRDQWDQVVADPSMARNAVEEVMRFMNSVWIVMPRYATEDFELAGKSIRKGDKALSVLPAADRDPAFYAEPDTFDISRSNAKAQLGFGTGSHVCSGQWLARIEVEEVLIAITRSYPNTTLVLEQDISWKPEFGGRNPRTIEVTMAR